MWEVARIELLKKIDRLIKTLSSKISLTSKDSDLTPTKTRVEGPRIVHIGGCVITTG